MASFRTALRINKDDDPVTENFQSSDKTERIFLELSVCISVSKHSTMLTARTTTQDIRGLSLLRRKTVLFAHAVPTDERHTILSHDFE